ncbi:MAG: nucleotidyltransferase domain-containing protein, partial [Chloroflexi bacterium]
MSLFPDPTPYPDVNTALRHFSTRVQAVLGEQFLGMYLYGSLALGDFDPQTSDIDFIVATKTEIAEDHFTALQALHEQFDAGGSAWAGRIEAAYIPQA